MTQHTLQHTPSAVKRAVILSIVQVIVSVTAFLSTTFESAALLMLFALCGVAALVVTGIMWGISHAVRRTMRIVFALPIVVASLGVVCAVVTELFGLSVTHMLNLSMSGADTPFWYTLLFDTSVTVTYAHTMLLFLFPAMVAATAFGEKTDRRNLCIAVMAHLAAMTASVFVFAQLFGIPSWNDMSEHVPTWRWGSIEITLMQIVMLVIAVVFAAFAFWAVTDKKKSADKLDA